MKRICKELVILSIVFAAFSLNATAQANSPQDQAGQESEKPTVEVIRVVESTEYETTYYGARVEPVFSHTQPVPFAGTIFRLYVKDGATVRKNDPLYTITRTSQVSTGDFAPLTVRALSGGIVSTISFNEGDEVTENASITIADISSLKAVITVSDKDILSLKLNMPCSIPSMDSLSGKITRISVLPDTKSGLYDVDIIFPNSASLFPGKFVNIEILVNPVKGTYIPTSAVVSRYGKKLVFAIRNGTAEMLDITVLNIKGETTLVSGIPSGEHIAVSNTRMLIPGMQVVATPVDTSQLQ